MTSAAGILFLTKASEALFLKRGDGGDFPGFWCLPGGHTEGDETPEQTAERETIEELGFLPDGTRTVLTRSINVPSTQPAIAPDLPIPEPNYSAPVDYTTFLQRIPERFDPQVSGEHTGFAWSRLDAPPEPLHPGCRIALDRLTMDELGVARAMAAGQLTSPQRYQNMWLFDIRITGTGHAYRNGIKEHVWRDPALYLTDDFLARCSGLTVIWVHPEKSLLNSKEFANRVIGSCFIPYIKGDDVWSIVKIYDQEAAEDMATQDLSTSPGVLLGGGDDVKVEYEDGSVLLKEGKPTLLDHIAIVPAGVWDKGGDPSGIRTDSVKEPTMAEETEAEKKAREDKARGDAEGGNIDKVLSHLDGIGKRLDAIEARDKARADAEEKARRDADEMAMADAGKRRDAEREAWMKEDAAECARDDAEEEKERGEHEKKGEAKEAAADKARKDRRDRMDKRRKDAEKAEADRKDAEERARSDSQTTIAKAVADALAKHARSDADTEALADTQMRADAVHNAFGTRAPAPMSGETTADYQLRLARNFQKHSARWKDINLGVLEPAARGIAIGDIYNDAVVASRRTDDLPEGQIIYTTRTDATTGHRITEGRGRNTFIHSLKRDSMRVTKFMTERRA